MTIYIVKSLYFNYFHDYIKSIQTIIPNMEICDMNETDEFKTFISNNCYGDNRFIFVQSISPFFYDLKQFFNYFYILNTEQNSRHNCLNLMNQFPDEIKIIDYSKENIKYYGPHKTVIYMPYQVNMKEIKNYKKIYDFAIVSGSSSKRDWVVSELKKTHNVNVISGWEDARDDILFKHKILLNIHFNDEYKVFEQFRCNRCILNNMIVITDKSDLTEYELKDYVIVCDYDDIVSTCIKVLDHYEYYYKKIFDNFDIDDILKKYKTTTETII